MFRKRVGDKSGQVNQLENKKTVPANFNPGHKKGLVLILLTFIVLNYYEPHFFVYLSFIFLLILCRLKRREETRAIIYSVLSKSSLNGLVLKKKSNGW